MKTIMSVAATAALAVASLASPARAGDTQCIWDNLPPAQVQALMDEALKRGGSIMPSLGDYLTVESVSQALLACKVKRDHGGEAGAAFMALFRQRVAETQLSKTQGITPAQLDEAWKRQDAAQIAQLAAAIAGDPNSEQQDRFNKLVESMVGAFTPAPAFEPMANYVYGRLMRASQEPLF